MTRKETNSVFEAKAKSLHDLFISEGAVAGFRIPIYQRHYDWDKANIQRFFEDILSGLTWRVTDEDSLTFLGTIIVLDEETKEKAFDGRSLSIIDGQQRLTTVALLGCIIYEILGKKIDYRPKIPQYVEDWLKRESRYIRFRLLDFVYGKLPVDGCEYFPFPRIIREGNDTRGNNSIDSEYRSVIAQYLNDFALHVKEKMTFSFKFTHNKRTLEFDTFLKNQKFIVELINFLSDVSDQTTNDLSEGLPILPDFEKRGFRKLFHKLPSEQSMVNRIFSYCKEHGEKILGTLRLLSFASFLMDAVIITLVKARDEKYGFDIFDSLNTTGEPLTAIQTFKPQVIRFEKEKSKDYIGSPSEECFKIVENYINKYSGSDARQKEAKDLIVPFALYLTGEKKSRNLDDQRRYLRNNFEKIDGKSEVQIKRLFVRKLAEIADYKDRFWLNSNIENQLTNYPEKDLLKLCLKFLKDLNTSLTIPILCRYFTASQEECNKELFAQAIKALTAFVVLRRGVTGGTLGIDSDLRSLMSYGRRKKDSLTKPLCVGLEKQNQLVDIPTLRKYLREWLSKKKIEIHNKDSWVKKVSAKDLYLFSTHLCRFLLLAAVHNSRPVKEEPWKLIKAKNSTETQYLIYQRWISPEIATVEHIAPASGSSTGWDSSIYSQPNIKHCLGNLTLLPQEENSAVANSGWHKKKLLYQAFITETSGELEYTISKAEKEGIKFSNKNIELLRKGAHLPITRTIPVVKEWSREVIEKRSKNIAGLAWDEISPWLFEG